MTDCAVSALVAEEGRPANAQVLVGAYDIEVAAEPLRGGPGALPLRLHLPLKALPIDTLQAVLPGYLLYELGREAIGVVQDEDLRPQEDVARFLQRLNAVRFSQL